MIFEGVDSHRPFSDKSLNSLIKQERIIKERNLLQRYSKQEQRNPLKRRGDCAYQEAGFNTFGERLVLRAGGFPIDSPPLTQYAATDFI